MNLHDHLAHDLDQVDTHIDIDHLGRVARTQGTRALRRRRAGAVLGSLAVVAVMGVGASLLPHGPSGANGDSLAADGAPAPASTFDPAHPGPTDVTNARGIAAALRWAISEEAGGTFTNFSGEDGHEWYSDLEWTPTDGEGLSVVGINVQPGEYQPHCDDASVIDCRTSLLPDGTRVTSYDEHTVVASGTGISRSVFLKSPDGLRVVVSETNGFDLPSSQWRITRPQPPLSVAQLTTIAHEAFWGTTLPTYFLDEGKDLAPYTQLEDLAGAPMTTGMPSPR